MKASMSAALERFERSCRDIEQLIALVKPHQTQALQVAYKLDLGAVPCDAPERIYIAPDDWIKAMREQGFDKLFGLVLVPESEARS